MRNKKGFTLLEILLVVACIAILAGVIILALNPNKQLGDTRNTARRQDVVTIMNAIYQYSIDNNGNLPTSITQTPKEICRTSASCTGLVDLSTLTLNEKYLTSMPIDPSGTNTNGTGYFVFKTINERVTVTAPSAESGATIQITR